MLLEDGNQPVLRRNLFRKLKVAEILTEKQKDFEKVMPIFHSLPKYAREKARLRKLGQPIDDFDLLIGATAITHKMVLVTNNVNHFKRIKGIKVSDWTK